MPCGDAAVHLPVDQQRVDDGAGVVAGDVADEPHLAGVGVDLDDGDVGAERERRAAGREVGLGEQLVDALAGAAAARSAQVRALTGVPATANVPATGSSTMSAGSASSRSAASFRASSTTSSAAACGGRAADLQ